MTPAQAEAVLDFWFSHDRDDWWKVNPAFDDEIRDRFRALREEQRGHVPEHFLADPDTALAAVILFDQFPRNMFRGHADQFSTDPLAPGSIYTASVDDQGKVGLYRLEVGCSAGTGRLKSAGGVEV